MRHACRSLPLSFTLLMLGAATVFAQLTPDFMPPGGKAILTKLLGSDTPDPAALREFTAASHDEDTWRKIVGQKGAALSEREKATLTAYLAINMPANAGAQDGPISSLPQDGRDIAWWGCQSCHSLFTSHLTQDRDLQGWRGMFESPFHRELKISPKERETFARYSAINMPMKIEDVPEDLRF